ncbi:MAG: MinD/ParA family protein, partial [Deltaproteobacteria bacterium]|nr:MinD/ParA family protein [Deltaproteobacteria bacterium]
RVLGVASGKGGVGKTNIVSNLAIAFSRAGKRVLAMDGDLGLANLDIAFGLTPDMTLLDLFDGTGTIEEVICDGPEGVKLLPGCSGRYDVANLNEQERFSLFAAIDSLEDDFDILMVDTGAGLNSNAVAFAAAAQTVILVADPDPTSLADAYAFVKVMATRCGIKKVDLIANRVANAKEGEDVYRKLSVLVNRFLQVGINYLGYINTDAAISRATRGGVPVLLGEPNALASQRINSIAHKILAQPYEAPETGGIRLFWKRLVGWKEVS